MLLVNENTISNLAQVANMLDETMDNISNSGNALNASFEENKDALGPHSGEIQDMLEDLKSLGAESEKAIVFISQRLRTLIPKYEEILSKHLGTP